MRLSIQKESKNFKVVESNDPLKTITVSKNCSFGLSNDTGCGHLISASGIPTLTIFGPTDAEKFLPIGNEKTRRYLHSYYMEIKILTELPLKR